MKKHTLNEDLFLDIPEVEYELDTNIELDGPKPGEDVGVSGLLLDLIGKVASDINELNQLQANLENYPEISELIKDFADDENEKLGKIQSALKTISPNAELIMNGAVEAEKELDPGSPLDESLNESYHIVDLDTGDSFGHFDSVDSAKSKAQRYSKQCFASCAVVNDNNDVVCGYINGKERSVVNESFEDKVKYARNASIEGHKKIYILSNKDGKTRLADNEERLNNLKSKGYDVDIVFEDGRDITLKESYAIVNYWDYKGEPKNKVINGKTPKDVENKVRKIADSYSVNCISQASDDVANSEYLKSLGSGVRRIDYFSREFEPLNEAYDDNTIKEYFDDAWDKYADFRDALYAFETATEGKDLGVSVRTFIRDLEEAAGDFWSDYQYYTNQEEEIDDEFSWEIEETEDEA